MPTPCACRPIRVEDLDEAVWNQVERLLEQPAMIRAELQRRREEHLKNDPLGQRKRRLQQELQRVGQQIDKLLDAYQEGLIGLGQLRERMPALRKKQSAAQKELDGAHWQALAEAQLQQLDESLESFLRRLKESAQKITVADKQKIIRLLVKEVLVEKDAITVRHCIPFSQASGDGGTPNLPPPSELALPTSSFSEVDDNNGQNYQVCLWSHQPQNFLFGSTFSRFKLLACKRLECRGGLQAAPARWRSDRRRSWTNQVRAKA